jgi:hypothetical protein
MPATLERNNPMAPSTPTLRLQAEFDAFVVDRLATHLLESARADGASRDTALVWITDGQVSYLSTACQCDTDTLHHAGAQSTRTEWAGHHGPLDGLFSVVRVPLHTHRAPAGGLALAWLQAAGATRDRVLILSCGSRPGTPWQLEQPAVAVRRRRPQGRS